MDRRFIGLVRIAGVVATLALVGVCVSDFETSFWVDHAMFTAVLSALLVATVLGAVVDSYLERRDLRRWQRVAGVATGEFAFVSRWVRRGLLDSAGLPAPDDPEETLALLRTHDGAVRISAAIDAVAHDPEARARLYPRVRDMLDGAGQTLGRWSPLMVRGEHVKHLNDFVNLAGRVWKLMDELSKEAVEHRAIPLGEDWVAGRVANLIEVAARLEVGFDAAARALAPPDDWTGPPEWFLPAAERETAPAG